MNALMKCETKGILKEDKGILKEDFEKSITLLVERLDFWDVQILRKFYMTGKDFPFDTQPHCFPILFREMRTNHHLKIGMEALRKRLGGFVDMGLLEKIKSSNPTSYVPVAGKEQLVRAVVTKFFLMHGFTRFV